MKRGRKIKRDCQYCGNEFELLMIKARQGKGLYCNTTCYHSYRKEHSKDPKYLNIIHQKTHKYGITESEYLGMFENQNNSCAICETSFGDVRACVDHSHKTGVVRGLLCDSCNKGLGMFKDNPELLIKAIKYLK